MLYVILYKRFRRLIIFALSVIRPMTGLALETGRFLEMAQSLPVIDVRTPAEYYHAHIRGAVNMPLFTNEERSVIGTLYLKKGSDTAITKGLELIRPKMQEFTEAGFRIAGHGEALMHCWRGGMRSSSMAWLMNTIGIKTYTLMGGYRQFRRYAAEIFAKPLRMVVIGGSTGSGKTDILNELKLRGMQVIDLERLASHKGSVFGAIGMPEQPSCEQFENDLFAEIYRMSPDEPVFIEDESLAIGNVFIPRSFYNQMSSSDYVHIDVPFETRLYRLITEYASGPADYLIAGIRRLQKRLGMENTVKAEKFIVSGNIHAAAEIVLKYYDKIYARSMSIHNRRSVHQLKINNETPAEISDLIIKMKKEWKHD